MATPLAPLKLSLPPAEKMKLDDLELFEDGGFTIRGFKAFMTRYSNWSAAEVGQLELGQMRGLAEQIRDALNESAVPKANAQP